MLPVTPAKRHGEIQDPCQLPRCARTRSKRGPVQDSDDRRDPRPAVDERGIRNRIGYDLRVNAQFSIALHILGFLTARGGEPLTSEVLAETYGTSPIVLRRVLSKLQRAGLIETRRGVGGGSVLARAPKDIDLREAYEAVNQGNDLLPRHPGDGSGGVAPIVGKYVNELCEDAERALLARLEAVTVAEMDRVVRRRILSARRCRPRPR